MDAKKERKELLNSITKWLFVRKFSGRIPGYSAREEGQNSSIAGAVCVNIKSIFFGSLSGLRWEVCKLRRREEPERIGYGFLRANLDGGLIPLYWSLEYYLPFGIEKLIKEKKEFHNIDARFFLTLGEAVEVV